MSRSPSARLSSFAVRLSALLFLASAMGTRALDISLHPANPQLGDTLKLVLTSTAAVPQLATLPEIEALQWLSETPRVMRSERSDGRHTERRFTSTYFLRALQPGNYRLPALTVRVGENTLETNPQDIVIERVHVATASGEKLDLNEVVFAELTFDGSSEPPESLYVGERLAVAWTVYVLAPVYEGMEYPTLNMDGAVFRDFSPENPRHPRFRAAQLQEVTRDGRRFRRVAFRFEPAPITPGSLSGALQTQCSIRLSETQSMLRRGRTKTYQTAAKLPPVEVLPLPPRHAEDTFLGLVGDWRLTASLDTETVRAGDAVTLTVQATGHGAVELLTPPELEFDGFRVFDPEVERQPDRTGPAASATMTWVLVPQTDKASTPQATFSTFDPVAETYRRLTWTPDLTVTPPQNGNDDSVVVGSNDNNNNNEVSSRPETNAGATEILYLKRAPAVLRQYLPRPLWQRALPHLPVAIAGPLVFLAMAAWARRQDRLAADPGLRRRAQAGRLRRQALARLRSCPPEERPTVVCEKLAPALAAGMNLPRGTTPSELASRLEIDYPELAQALRTAEAARYQGTKGDAFDPTIIARTVAKLGALVLLLFLVPAPSHAAARTSSIADQLSAARETYDHGHPAEARRQYAACARPGHENAALLYNRGNCRFLEGDLGHALALFERARRLAPRDSAIRENLRFIRRKLGLPTGESKRNPIELLVNVRDRCRPDEWLIVAAWTLFALGVVAGVARLRGTARPSRWFTASATALILLALLSAFAQSRGPYRSDRTAVVVSANPKLRRLPANNASLVDAPLSEGRRIRILERRTDWVRVSIGKTEAWIHGEDVMPLW